MYFQRLELYIMTLKSTKRRTFKDISDWTSLHRMNRNLGTRLFRLGLQTGKGVRLIPEENDMCFRQDFREFVGLTSTIFLNNCTMHCCRFASNHITRSQPTHFEHNGLQISCKTILAVCVVAALLFTSMPKILQFNNNEDATAIATTYKS